MTLIAYLDENDQFGIKSNSRNFQKGTELECLTKCLDHGNCTGVQAVYDYDRDLAVTTNVKWCALVNAGNDTIISNRETGSWAGSNTTVFALVKNWAVEAGPSHITNIQADMMNKLTILILAGKDAK